MPKHSLSDAAAVQLAAAKDAPSGVSSEILVGDEDSSLTQTVVALTEGHSMSVRESPEEATLLVLSGSVRVRTARGPEDASKGDLVEIPTDPHTITAEKDVTALLTVADDHDGQTEVSSTGPPG